MKQFAKFSKGIGPKDGRDERRTVNRLAAYFRSSVEAAGEYVAKYKIHF